MQKRAAGEEDSVKCLLAAHTLRRTGLLRLRASGSSMLPALRPGDILLIESREIGEIQVGEIAAFECYGRIVIHRVIEIHRGPHGSSLLIARGDSLPRPDPPVTQSELLGTVIRIERGGKFVSPSSRLTPLGRIAATMLGRFPRTASLL
jgi:signal peptidase I